MPPPAPQGPRELCPLCEGKGKVAGVRCRLCDGEGTVPAGKPKP